MSVEMCMHVLGPKGGGNDSATVIYIQVATAWNHNSLSETHFHLE